MTFAHNNPMYHYSSDPTGAAEIWRAKLDRAIKEFVAGRWSPDVFRRSLYALGFRGQNLENEFLYHEQDLIAARRRRNQMG